MENVIKAATLDMEEFVQAYTPTVEKNTIRVLNTMRKQRLCSQHFPHGSGYGYNDLGRDKLEEVYADVFGAEAALMRQQIVSGTHAISLALLSNLLPGDELLTLGQPYDTLQSVIGSSRITHGCMLEMGIKYRNFDIDFATPNLSEIVNAVHTDTKIVALQRSRGYSSRNSLNVAQITAIKDAIKKVYPQVIVFVDNCYGEMVETAEPTHYGIDLMAGSLIKNPGAGLTPSGGYIVGKSEYVERAASRLTFPGAGREVGASLVDNGLYFQALFLSPTIVAEALAGAIFTASLLKRIGFSVSPGPDQNRTDIIQAVKMANAQQLIAFCQGIQKYSPVDSFVSPEPWPMPGYDNDIIMAAGGFVQGSSIELSADAPIREPYLLFIQGGLSRFHTKYAVIQTVLDMKMEGLL